MNALILGCIWVLAATGVAMLPMRYQYVPGLALLLAALSSFRSRALPKELIVFGELGLTGEVRAVANGQERLNEARKHGFRVAIIPHANRPKQAIDGMVVHGVKNLAAALDVVNGL